MGLNKKKAIIILTEWYLPGRKAGGPVKSIESLVWEMKDYFDFYILTTNTDLGELTPYKNIQIDQWISQNDGSKIYYLDKHKLSKNNILEALRSVPFEYMYINSLYSKWFSVLPLRLYQNKKISCQIVLAPRGMLSSGALKIKSFKKKSFIFISRLLGLHNHIKWHATSKIEEVEIKKHFGKDASVTIIENFSKPLSRFSRDIIKKPGYLKLFFLSRVTKVKNLHIAIESLFAFNNTQYNIVYDIYGNLEDVSYYKKCISLIKNLGSNIKVEFKGELKNENIFEMIKNYHFLFLPTSNENFGHSIIESLQCGVPVIISNKTPWRNLREHGCGWDLEPLPEFFKDSLEFAINLNDVDYSKMSEKSLAFVELVSNSSKKRKQYFELFS